MVYPGKTIWAAVGREGGKTTGAAVGREGSKTTETEWVGRVVR